MKTNTNRFYLIDSLRGFAVFSMVIYHFVWDLNYVAGVRWGSFSSLYNFLWQQSICLTFILISGFCYHLSRHPLKNSLIALLCGAAVTLATALLTPDSAIWFGVLTFLGSAMLICLPIRKLLYKIPSGLGFAICFCLFILCYDINDRTLVFGQIALPSFLYDNMFTAFLGFPPRGFFSADYFSLFPWIFLFLGGFFLGSLIKRLKEPPSFLFFRVPFFEWIGRHALIIYMLHQPLLYGLTLLIGGI